MGIFDVSEEKLKAMYHRAWLEAGRGYVDPKKFPYLREALFGYMQQHHCSLDQALIIAKN